ncbi:MAG TPA: peptidyl-prolyl cis-trans isomerase, partial [Tepidisphaeraceae bacterium]|nr:peptidyl-prolyl cis-trans isomerase [Tepidisphaeraceae bacterium]
IEGYGLNVLLNIVQLDLAKQEAARAGATVSPEDINNERQMTFAKMFQDADKSDYEQLFTQFLQQEHISRVEFDLVLATNANLRKVAEPLVKGKITDAALQEAFRQLYGETVQVRHIQLANMQEVIEAKRRLSTNEPFAQVAQEMSRNARTATLGGELPPFSRQAAGYPQAFKDAAFALKEGEVSDAVQAEGAYHLIQLEHRIAPKAVKFEDVKDSLREDLTDRLVQATIKDLRTQIAQDAIKELVIDDPTLKQQYDSKLHQSDEQIKDRNQIRQQFEKERQRILQRAATQQSTTAPTTIPATTSITTTPAAQPPAPEVARPPATKSGTSTQKSPDPSSPAK